MTFASVPGVHFSVSGVPLAQNSTFTEAGADLYLSVQARVGVAYCGEFADRVTVDAVQASFTWSF